VGMPASPGGNLDARNDKKWQSQAFAEIGRCKKLCGPREGDGIRFSSRLRPKVRVEGERVRETKRVTPFTCLHKGTWRGKGLPHERSRGQVQSAAGEGGKERGGLFSQGGVMEIQWIPRVREKPAVSVKLNKYKKGERGEGEEPE